jgi:hypothetical protein
MTHRDISKRAVIAPRNVHLALVSRAFGQLQSLAGQEHGRTIPINGHWPVTNFSVPSSHPVGISNVIKVDMHARGYMPTTPRSVAG